ncbi:hypothetical protein JCM11491_002983 [Sporobolomyces phaffii]
MSTGTAGENPRKAAIAMLKRAASTRESPSGSDSPSPASSPTLSRPPPRTRPRAYTSHSRPEDADTADPDDRSFFPNPPGQSSLERTASLLARQLAMAKLTGTAPPTPPPTFFAFNEPLPTLEDLQRRARAKLELENGRARTESGSGLRRTNTTAAALHHGQTPSRTSRTGTAAPALKRNNTVTGIGGLGAGNPTEVAESIQLAQARLHLQPRPRQDDGDEPPTERSEARVNLMRKLSARRLASPAPSSVANDRLGVVGRIGRARPRSGSLGGLDWRLGRSVGESQAEGERMETPAPPAALPLQLGPALSLDADRGEEEGEGHGIGMGISMDGNGTDRSESPSTRRSSAGGGWKDPNEPSTDEDEPSDEDRNIWEYEQVLQPPTFSSNSANRPESEMEHIRDSKQHLPPPIQTTALQSSPHPSFRSFTSSQSNDKTPKAQWAPSFLASAIPNASSPSSATTIQQPRFSGSHLVDEAISPNSSPQYPNPDWPTYDGQNARRPSLSAVQPNSDVHLNLATPLTSASVSPSVFISSSSTSSSEPSFEHPHAPRSNERTQRPAPTFGIAAVETPNSGFFGLGGGIGADRKRGSSASSSLALLEASRRARERGSDATQLQLGSIGTANFSRSRMGSAVSSIDSTGSGSASGRLLEKVDAKGEDEVERLQETGYGAVKGRQEDERRFPPPQDGYQFPASPKEKTAGSGPSPSRQVDTSSSPSSPPPRKARDFPFKLPFQPANFPATPSDSPILPDPISPTAVLPDPFLNLRFPPPAREADLEQQRTIPNAASTSVHPAGHTMVKSPSTESHASSTGHSSTYHSPTLMRRDLSSTSASSESTQQRLLSPRLSPLPANELPANRILAKLDSLFASSDDSLAPPSSGSSPLDTPPRKLLLHAPVLQVVNANTVKDRYLLLFTDLLVIAKPLIAEHPLTGEPISPSLDNQFLVKSVVELKNLKVTATEDPAEESAASSSSSKKRHPLLVAFVDRFANEPTRAIATLVQKGGLTNDGPTISNLLFKNTDLNRNQLGAYLANPNHRHVLRSYIERFRFGGVRIDDALRLFLMSVRFPPQDRKAAEYVLGVLANVWAEMNVSSGFDPSLAFSLIVSILRLSDVLHSSEERDDGEGPILPSSRATHMLTVDEFIGRFRENDTRMVVQEDLLSRIYTSVRRERIEQASDNSIFSMTPDIEATIEPAKLPTHLTYRTPSDVFTITVPAPDTKFSIKLAGPDLVFDPPVLSFARSATQSFRVTGTALGVRVMVLIKRGANAPRYQGLPLNKAFSIERAFMQNTFQVSFTNHLDVKRKYMFAVSDATIRSQWLSTFRKQLAKAHHPSSGTNPTLAAAQAVSTQVLRDVFLPPDELVQISPAAPSPRPNLTAPQFGRPVTATPRTRLGTPTRAGGGMLARSNSISKMYASQFKEEADLSDRKQSLINNQLRLNGAGGGGPRDDVATLGGSQYAKTGHDLVLTTEQNSLLPVVLSFLNSGLEAAPHPLSLQGSAFQLPPLAPATSSPSSGSAPSAHPTFPLVGFPFNRR